MVIGAPDFLPALSERVAALNGHGELLTFSDMDEQARMSQASLLIDALTKANKPYDLIFVPNGEHGHLYDHPYVMKRMWDYFIKNLRGAMPVRDFRIEQSP